MNSLIKAELFEKAGEFHERKGDAQKALEYYCKGNVYHKAVDLARRKNPQLVNKLEEKWLPNPLFKALLECIEETERKNAHDRAT